MTTPIIYTNANYKRAVSPKGYIIKKKYFSEQKISELKHELTVMPIVIEGYQTEKPEPYKVYKESDNKLYLPRYFGINKFGKPDINLFDTEAEYSVNPKMIIPEEIAKLSIKLRSHQEPIVKSYLDSAKECGGGTICAGCGIGKTGMAIYITGYFKLRTLILVHKEFLLNQWRDRFKEFMPNVRIGVIQGPKCDVLGCDVVIGMVQSVSKKDDYPSYTFQNFGLLIVDEAHHMSSRSFCKALPKTSFKYTLALTATPKRADGLQNVFLWYMGPIVYKSVPKKDSQVKVNIYQYQNNRGSYCKEYANYKGLPNNGKMITNIAESDERNRFIGTLLSTLIRENRKILILTERLSQVAWFMSALENRFKVDGVLISVGKYVGGMGQSNLEKSLEARIIIGTYSMISEGFDCQELDTLIMASPKGDIEQTVGRILRKEAKDRDRMPLIIDIWDMFGSYYNKGFKRIKYYSQRHYLIENYTVIDNKDKPLEIIKELKTPSKKEHNTSTPPSYKF